MDRTEEKKTDWFPLRITGGSGDEFKRYLDESGIENYFNAAAFRNICFVKASMPEIEKLKADLAGRISLHFLWDGSTFRPARIPDKVMRDFLMVSGNEEERPLYLEKVSVLLKDCQKVRVTSGKFIGIEGRLVRIKKTRRVMIELAGDLAVATGYIRPECMEVIG